MLPAPFVGPRTPDKVESDKRSRNQPCLTIIARMFEPVKLFFRLERKDRGRQGGKAQRNALASHVQWESREKGRQANALKIAVDNLGKVYREKNLCAPTGCRFRVLGMFGEKAPAQTNPALSFPQRGKERGEKGRAKQLPPQTPKNTHERGRSTHTRR